MNPWLRLNELQNKFTHRVYETRLFLKFLLHTRSNFGTVLLFCSKWTNSFAGVGSGTLGWLPEHVRKYRSNQDEKKFILLRFHSFERIKRIYHVKLLLLQFSNKEKKWRKNFKSFSIDSIQLEMNWMNWRWTHFLSIHSLFYPVSVNLNQSHHKLKEWYYLANPKPMDVPNLMQ